MKIRVIPLFAILLLSCGAEKKPDMSGVPRFPFHPGAADCLKRIDGIEVLGDGARRLMVIVGGYAPFQTRLRDLQAARGEIVNAYRALPDAKQDPRDENDFVCVADDLLEGMFAAEIGRVKSEPDFRAELERLRTILDSIDLDPSWNEYARARLIGLMQTD